MLNESAAMTPKLTNIRDWAPRARAVKYRVEALAEACCVSMWRLNRFFLTRTDLHAHARLNRLKQMDGLFLLAQGFEIKDVAGTLNYSYPARTTTRINMETRFSVLTPKRESLTATSHKWLPLKVGSRRLAPLLALLLVPAAARAQLPGASTNPIIQSFTTSNADVGPNHEVLAPSATTAGIAGTLGMVRASAGPSAARGAGAAAPASPAVPATPATPAATNKVIALASGLNYWDDTASPPQWTRSVPAFTQTTNGFVADRLQTKVHVANDLHIAGAITLTFSDGTPPLRSSPVALALKDPDTGTTTIIATNTSCTGMLMRSNELVFPGALSGPGGLIADIVIRIGRATFEQDAVVRTKLDVTSYGVSSNALIQVMTELYDPPPQPPAPDISQLKANRAALRATAAATRASKAAANQAAAGKAAAAPTTAKVWLTTNGGPTYVQVSGSRIWPSTTRAQSVTQLATNSAADFISTQSAGVVSTDTTATLSSPVRQAPISATPSEAGVATNSTPDDPVRFGQLSIARGIAYSTRNAGQTNRPAYVTKQIVTNEDQRIFLIESVKSGQLRNGLLSLPQTLPSSGGGASVVPTSTPTYAATPPTLPRSPLPRSDTSPLLAQAPAGPEGVVIDYCATLYYYNDTLDLTSGYTWLVVGPVYCTSVVINPDVCVKFVTGASITLGGYGASVTSYATGESPAIFTGVDDDYNGESLAGYEDAAPYYTGYISYNYASPAFHITSDVHFGPDIIFSNCRFLYAQTAIAYDCPPEDEFLLAVSDCEFRYCGRCIELDGAWSCETPTAPNVGQCWVSLQNVLMDSDSYPFDVEADNVYVYLSLNNCCIHYAYAPVLRPACYYTPTQLTAHDSIFISIPGGLLANASGANNAFYEAPEFGDQFLRPQSEPPSDVLFAVAPQSQSVDAGASVEFDALAIGVGPISYQWTKQGSGGSIGSSASLNLTSVQLGAAGIYAVRATNPNGGQADATASLTIGQGIAAPLSSSAVAWWRAEGNANDSYGGNNGSEHSVSHEPGKVGQAFSLAGGHVRVPVRDLGSPLRFTGAMTVEAWVHPFSSGYYGNIIARWDAVGGINQRAFTLGYGPDGHVYIGVSPNGWDALSLASTSALELNQWSHVAGTYSGSGPNSGLRIYVNGICQNTTPYDGGIYAGNDTSNSGNDDLAIGGVVGGLAAGYAAYTFAGLIDEATLYSDALSADDIFAIYNAGSAGKYDGSAAPIIRTQPENLNAWVGDSVTLSVVAVGTPPLTYSWKHDGGIVSGATASSITLSSVQMIDAGLYQVTVTDGATHSVASDTGLHGNVTVTQPYTGGPVSWWRAEDNANDSTGVNHGMAHDTTYESGKVGKAFNLGTGGHVRIPDAANLRFTTRMTVECWVYPTAHTAGNIVAKWDAVGGVNQRSYTLGVDGDGHVWYGFGVDCHSACSSTTLQLGQWSHVAGTYDHDAGQLLVYVNGTPSAPVPYTQDIFPGTDDLAIGGVVGGLGDGSANYTFSGMIDEVAVYDNALPAEAIQGIFAAGSAGLGAFAST